jgi:outer membrane PBP1 activator LpoA protein
MAAFARQARQLRPQLKFYRASDLPVYATSHVYSGKSSPRQDRDLDGVMFGDMPWLLSPDVAEPALQQAIQQSWANTAATYSRLVAFGVDAYRLIPHLRRLQVQPYAPFEGVTGSIVLDESNRVNRALEWAQFRHGRARLLETDIPFP